VMEVRPQVLSATLYSGEGRIFASYSDVGIQVPLVVEQPGFEGYFFDGDDVLVFRPVVENGQVIGTLRVRGVYEPWARLKAYLGILFAVMLASLAIAVFLGGWLQHAVTAPLLDVARVSRGVVERRDFSLRARKTTEDEIGELVDAFNAMLAEIGRRSDAMRDAEQRKDEFLATLAHELRNPLAPIRNALHILKVMGDDPSKAAMAREMMQRQLAQMVRLVDDLLDVSRITTGKLGVRMERLDLRLAVRDAVEAARPAIQGRAHRLDLQLPQQPLFVEGDQVRLAQVFANLLNNAAKYTEAGGSIVVEASCNHYDAVVKVKDSGVGLAPEIRERVFEMFFQVGTSLERSTAGLGVGLTLARRLVELHGGTLTVESDGPGLGSEFIVCVPLAEANPLAGPAPAELGALTPP
jgi:two-component system, sensor histidine kinase